LKINKKLQINLNLKLKAKINLNFRRLIKAIKKLINSKKIKKYFKKFNNINLLELNITLIK